MTTNSEGRQATCRATSGTTHHVDGDWMAYFESFGITTGTFNERMLTFCNRGLGATWDVAAWDEVLWDGTGEEGNYTNINDAMCAFAESNGMSGKGSMFSSLGSF